MITTDHSRALAERYLAELPRRCRHVQGVGNRAEHVAGALRLADGALVAAAWLHDIGLSRVSQDRADVVEVFARGLHEPVGGARDLFSGLGLEDQPQGLARFLDVAGRPVGHQTLRWHRDELGHEHALSPDCRLILVDGKRVELGLWRD